MKKKKKKERMQNVYVCVERITKKKRLNQDKEEDRIKKGT